MQFSDTTNKNGIIQRVEDHLGWPDGSITGDSTLFSRVTADVNEGYETVAAGIFAAQGHAEWDDTNYTTLPIAEAALTTSRLYSLETDNPLYKLDRVDVSYDGVTYQRAQQIDTNSLEIGLGNDDKTDDKFNKTQPAYDFIGNQLALYPRASSSDVSSGGKMRIQYRRAFDLFTTADTTQEPGFDRAHHHLLPIYAAMKRAVIQRMDVKNDLNTLFLQGMEGLRTHYSDKNEPERMSLRAAFGVGDYS